jgi:hypothetical protein
MRIHTVYVIETETLEQKKVYTFFYQHRKTFNPTPFFAY